MNTHPAIFIHTLKRVRVRVRRNYYDVEKSIRRLVFPEQAIQVFLLS